MRPCKFCNNPAVYSPLTEMEEFSIKVYFCQPCQAEYLYFKAAVEPSSVSLYTDVNNNKYRWTVMANGQGQLWKVGRPGIPGIRRNDDMQAVVRISDLEGIHITPKNIEAKIRSWLPFL